MSCQSRITEWTAVIRTHLPMLSQPQATVLALWRLGMVLARSCAVTAVAVFVAGWGHRKEQTVRQQLREFCYEVEAKRGDHRQALAIEPCFAPLLRWVLRWLAGEPNRLGPRCDHLGPALHRVGHQRRLARRCDSRGLDDPAGQRAPCLAP